MSWTLKLHARLLQESNPSARLATAAVYVTASGQHSADASSSIGCYAFRHWAATWHDCVGRKHRNTGLFRRQVDRNTLYTWMCSLTATLSRSPLLGSCPDL